MSVMTLAERVCPQMMPLNWFEEGSLAPEEGEPHSVSCRCNGTGALVPGLRRECNQNLSVGLHGHCPVCPSGSCNGQLVSAERAVEGRDWVLIPQAEQMGVLVRIPGLRCSIWEVETGWCANVNYGAGQGLNANTPEDALAEAYLATL